MNREILFRGKWVDNGEWVYGYLYQDGLIGCNIFQTKPHLAAYIVDPSTVCQFTGLTDKNGVKIFEGDIARGKYGSTVYQNEVIFAGDGFALRHSYDQYGYCASLEEHEGLEVIGNIFDHPELLEENNT